MDDVSVLFSSLFDTQKTTEGIDILFILLEKSNSRSVFPVSPLSLGTFEDIPLLSY